MSTILVADDQKMWYEAVKHVLYHRRGYSVIWANNGEKAFEIGVEKSPDLILADRLMIGSTFLYEKLYQDTRTKNIPVILFTIDALTERDIRNCRAKDYIKKPFDDEELIRKVDNYIIILRKGNIIISNPFEVPVSLINELTLQDYKKLYNFLEYKYAELIKEGFHDSEIRNIALCDHKVVIKTNLINGPSNEEIKEIQEKTGKICYVIGKEEMIEELGVSSWSLVNNDDKYPTVKVYIGKEEWSETEVFQKGEEITADFDTGNPREISGGYFVFNDTLHLSLTQPLEPIRRGKHLGEGYVYSLNSIKIAIKDIYNNTRCEKFEVRFVSDWRNSPFTLVSPSRIGFIGRELMYRLSLSITLNPKQENSVLYLL